MKYESMKFQPLSFTLLPSPFSKVPMVTNNNSNQTIIRLAQIGDSKQIAELCEQLGYPTSQASIEQRLSWKILGEAKPHPNFSAWANPAG